MAIVNFENAILIPIDTINYFNADYLRLITVESIWPRTAFFTTLTSEEGDISATSSLTHYVTNITENGFKIVYDGVFSANGNKFYIGYWRDYTDVHYRVRYWEVSGINFIIGDTFHFQIDVNFNFN